LLVIANQVPATATNAAFALSSSDGWTSAKVDGTQAIGPVYPTTATLRGDTLYVLHSKLNELIQAPPEQKSLLRAEATILEIGRLQHGSAPIVTSAR